MDTAKERSCPPVRHYQHEVSTVDRVIAALAAPQEAPSQNAIELVSDCPRADRIPVVSLIVNVLAKSGKLVELINAAIQDDVMRASYPSLLFSSKSPLTALLGDIFKSDGGTGTRVGFVSHKLRTRLMAKSCEPIPFPLENDATWEAIVSTESRFEKARKAVDRTVERHRKPTKYERQWIPISLLSLVGVSSAILLVRKSSLCGSNELDETLKAAYETMRTFFNSYMKTPSKELKQELTKAFDTGDREDAAARLEETQESLDRMLKEYVKNATKPGFSESLTRAYQSVGAMTAGGEDEHAGGGGGGEETTTNIDPMSLVTARVEEELKAPLQNMLGGDLMQLLLIQTQVMKVEMEDALLQMDAVMRANRLNFALMACFPATLLVYGSFSFSKTVGVSRAFQKRRKAREEMRLLVADAERSLMRLKMTRDEFIKRHRVFEDNKDASDSEFSEGTGSIKFKNNASDSDLVRRLEIAEEYRRRRLEMDASLDVNASCRFSDLSCVIGFCCCCFSIQSLSINFCTSSNDNVHG